MTRDVAERVEKAVGPRGVAERIRELATLISREEVAVKVAEEIVLGRFHVPQPDLAEQAVRTALAILDEGVTVAPIQGIASVKIREGGGSSKWIAVYFAGPIRAAGGTEMGLTVVVADYVRHLLGLDRFQATEEEAKRFVEELRLYEREVARFQYKVSDSDLFQAVLKIPVEVNGVETNPVEVAAYRDLQRIETNRVRGGALRVVNDGLIGRNLKVLRIVSKLGLNGWSWLKDLRAPTVDSEDTKELMYMEDVVAGRPIFSFPSTPGGFRLRYGRARDTGLAALGVHPATMRILKDFLATGTQVKIEGPGKAGIICPVDSIEPPIVKLRDGQVVRVEDTEKADEVAKSIDSILFLGDLLVSFGEFLENNKSLAPSGFVEEWWAHLLDISLARAATEARSEQSLSLSHERLREFVEKPFHIKPTAVEAVEISEKMGVPLHPRFTYFWNSIDAAELHHLVEKVRAAVEFQKGYPSRIAMELDSQAKSALEKLGVPHKIANDGRLVIEEDAPAIYVCLRNRYEGSAGNDRKTLEMVRQLSGLEIMDKAPVFVGARMGRPEKADIREMKPRVHALFPVGLSGGPRRNLAEAAKKHKTVAVELNMRKCPSCAVETYKFQCTKCRQDTVQEHSCPRCGLDTQETMCPKCKIRMVGYRRQVIDLPDILQDACKRLGIDVLPETVKGVRGLTSESKTAEAIEKGVLRALFGLSVFKDGTIRFDATNAPLTHFIPGEIGTSIDKLQSMGYDCDFEEEPLSSPTQLCALKIQDVILPRSCGEYFVSVAKYVDRLLQRFYELPPFYKIENPEGLIGHLIVGLSPHTSVGIIGRIVGFTRFNVCFAHPIWHAAKRRDCDGDEDSLALALNVLVDFSRAFLPARIGGLMDAPLLLSVLVNPEEVARQVFNLETTARLPLRFFEESGRRADPKQVSDFVELLSHRLGSERCSQPLGFTHPVSDINRSTRESYYKTLGSMLEKVSEQLALARQIRAVSPRDVAKRVLSTHFIRDLTGNLRAFATQRVRCLECNAKFRRIPLKGNCLRCGGKISLTVYKGSIKKYLDVAKSLVREYRLGTYLEQRLILLEQEIDSIFRADLAEEEKPQRILADYL